LKKQIILLLIVSILVASPLQGGHAIPTSGDYLLYCQQNIKLYESKRADESTASVCLGFVEGAIGMHAAFTASDQAIPSLCLPEHGIGSFDAISIWHNYLENNQDLLEKAPITTFISALSETYPCPESKTGE
jgi:hypothetical protein